MTAENATTPADPLAKLREPFAANQISKLPKPTRKQTDDVKADYKKGIRCQVCGSWHHPDVVHLDYVGHAAVTDRLLDVDPTWSWEPVALRDGLPAFDQFGGLWIKLTVCGVTRLGYGNAAPKQGGDPGNREKEVIGDAIRNAGMRFGIALDLWHKGDLRTDGDSDDDDAPRDRRSGEGQVHDDTRPAQERQRKPGPTSAELRKEGAWERFLSDLKAQRTVEELRAWATKFWPTVETWPPKWVSAANDEYNKYGKALVTGAAAPTDDDEPPR